MVSNAIGKRTADSTRVFARRTTRVYELVEKPCLRINSAEFSATGCIRVPKLAESKPVLFNKLIIRSPAVPAKTGSRKSVNDPCNPVAIAALSAWSYCPRSTGSIMPNSSNHLTAPYLFNAFIA